MTKNLKTKNLCTKFHKVLIFLTSNVIFYFCSTAHEHHSSVDNNIPNQDEILFDVDYNVFDSCN